MEFFIIPNFIKHRASVAVGPEVFPKLVTGILIVLSLVGLLSEYRRLKKEGGNFKAYRINFKFYIPHLLFITSGVIFLMAAPVLGFAIAGIPFMLFLLKLFGSDNRIFNLLVSIAYPITLFFIFTQFLRVNFPAGIFGI